MFVDNIRLVEKKLQLHVAAAQRQQCGLDDGAEDRTPPGPGAVGGHVGWVGDHRSVMCVELARLVSRTVVVRVTDRWQRTFDHTLQTKIHLDSTHHFVDHLLSCLGAYWSSSVLLDSTTPNLRCHQQCRSNFTVRTRAVIDRIRSPRIKCGLLIYCPHAVVRFPSKGAWSLNRSYRRVESFHSSYLRVPEASR